MGIHQEKAIALRPIIEQAMETGELTPEQMEQATNLFPFWDGNGVEYYAGDPDHKQSIVQHNELLWKCISPHKSQPDWAPGIAVSLWSRTSDPAEEWPEWIQPTGAHDAYEKGAKVSHNGKHWISEYDANVYEPGIFGWKEQ